MYKLLPGSTAKSNGSTIAAGQDFFGFSVAGESAPYIGAYNGDETFRAFAVPTRTPPLALLLLLSLCAVGTIAAIAALGARPKCLA